MLNLSLEFGPHNSGLEDQIAVVCRGVASVNIHQALTVTPSSKPDATKADPDTSSRSMI